MADLFFRLFIYALACVILSAILGPVYSPFIQRFHWITALLPVIVWFVFDLLRKTDMALTKWFLDNTLYILIVVYVWMSLASVEQLAPLFQKCDDVIRMVLHRLA